MTPFLQNIFQKNMKPRPVRLSLIQMFEFYSALKPGLPEQDEELLVDEIDRILDKLPKANFLTVMRLLYPNTDFSSRNAVEILIMFIRGIKTNNLFLFHEFMQGLNNGNSKRR